VARFSPALERRSDRPFLLALRWNPTVVEALLLVDETDGSAEVMNCIRVIVRALRLNTRAIERQLGISLAQLWVLQILNDGSVSSLNELAGTTATHQSSVSVVVSRLVQRGLVARTPAPDDKRRVQIELTEEGRRVMISAPTTVQVQLIVGLRQMAFERRHQLASLMREWLTIAGLDAQVCPTHADGGGTVMNMGVVGRVLLWLGLVIGIVGSLGLTMGFHLTGFAWLVAIGLAKLTLAASLGLMAGGAVLQRLSHREEQRRALQGQNSTPPA
jgi:DNA-binding MarR family transcriptional regulator